MVKVPVSSDRHLTLARLTPLFNAGQKTALSLLGLTRERDCEVMSIISANIRKLS